MLLALEMPPVNRQVQNVRILRWHQPIGSVVGYGDVLCEVVVERVAMLSPPSAASRMGGFRKRAAKTERVEFDVTLNVVVTSADQGVMRRHVAIEGDAVAVGEALAVLSTDPDEPLDTHATPSRFRSVANIAGED